MSVPVRGRRIPAAALVAFTFICAALLHAQMPPATRSAGNTPVIQVDTREVLVEVTVTDSKGGAVRGLTKPDFTLTDDGKPRELDDVSVSHDYRAISAQPGALHMPNGGSPSAGSAPATGQAVGQVIGHSSAIILDEANSFFADAAQARQNVLDLMGKLEPDERIALYIIVRKQGLLLLQDYTTDRELLRASLAKQAPTGMRPGGDFITDQPVPPYSVPPATRDEAYVMWRENSDQARLALQKLAEQLAAVPGRKSVFWLTNAFPPYLMKELGLQAGWDKTIAALNKADVAVNTVDTRGLYAASNQVTGTVGTMRQISDGTGGQVYFNRNDLDGSVAEGITASRAAYTLRFHLADDERDNRFHQLKVKVDRPGLELLYRQGYNAGGTGVEPDLLAGKIAGESLEARAAMLDAGTLVPTAQVAWFYTGTNRARVVVSMDVVPTDMAFRKDATGVHGQIEIVGIAALPGGQNAARFADTVGIDLEDQQHADSFVQTPWHYRHQFTVASGTYLFRLAIGGGPNAIGKLEIPLSIDPWNSASFGIGGIALSTEATAANASQAETGARLVAAGKEFVPAATHRFQPSDRLYFYTEIYEPALNAANPPTVTMQFRVVDLVTGETKMDTGMAGVNSYVHPGSPVIPFATALSVAQLPAGSYRLEVQAGHSSGQEIVSRTVDFDLN